MSAQQTAPAAKAARPAPIFALVAGVALVLALVTPRLLLFFPIMVVIACAVVSFFRRETWRMAAVVVAVLAVALVFVNEAEMAAPTGANLDAAKIASWNWRADRTFGEHGSIKWNVLVQNKTSRPLSTVKVDFTSYDASGKILASTFTYVDAVPPGGTQSTESFADLYGGEATAGVKISEVRFSE